MLVVLITHLGDRYLAVPLCEHIRRLGGVKTHECLIVSPVGTPMAGIEDVLRGAFGAVHTHQYNASMKGWPYGANEAAEAAMMHVASNPALRYHYLMLEPDCVPTTQEWLNRIDVDYRRAGGGVMGTRIGTQEMAPPHRIVGQHVIGVAVYPKNFAAVCPLVRGLSAMSLGYQAQNVLAPPWDAYVGPYAIKILTETRLIQHLARQMENTPTGLRFDCPSLEHALGQVKGDAVMIHGSKNPEFLLSIIRNYQLYATAPVQAPVAAIVSVPAPTVPKAPEAPKAQVAPTICDTLTPREQKQKAKDMARLMRVRTERGWDAMPHTPEWERSRFLEDMPWSKFRSYASDLGLMGRPGPGNSKGAKINRVIAREKEDRKEPWTKDLPEEEKSFLDDVRQIQPNPETSRLAVPSEGDGRIDFHERAVEEYPPLPPGSTPISSAGSGRQTTEKWGGVDERGNPIHNTPTPSGNRAADPMAEKMRALQANRQQMILENKDKPISPQLAEMLGV